MGSVLCPSTFIFQPGSRGIDVNNATASATIKITGKPTVSIAYNGVAVDEITVEEGETFTLTAVMSDPTDNVDYWEADDLSFISPPVVPNSDIAIFTANVGVVPPGQNSVNTKITVDTTPNISAEEAKQIVISEYNVGIRKEPELVIWYEQNNGTQRLIWYVITDSHEPSIVLIDAHSGDVYFAVIPVE